VPEPDPQLSRLLREHAVPGAVLGHLRGGEIEIVTAGVADTSTGDAMSSDTRFAVGSLTKPMVATAIARLAAGGALSFDDPAAAHVPELRGVAWAERATIRDLLANRSGLPLLDALEFPESSPEDDGVLARLAADVARAEPTPVAWSYTNVGWCLLGRALEATTARTWEDAMRELVFGPLGMVETSFTSEPVPRASGHAGLKPVEPWQPRALGPAGSTLLSTARDLLRLAEAHLEDDVLVPLREPQADVRIHGWIDTWCLGWAHFDGSVVGWDGLITGMRSALRFDPETRTAVVLLTNGSNGRNVYRSLFDVPLALEPSPDRAGDLSRFAGTYGWPDRRYTVDVRGDALVLDGDGRTVEAVPIDDRVFLVDAGNPDNPTVTFGDDVLYVMVWALPRITE
jgi:CubicO group peptidase (beta-lactamase class C family)